MLTKGDCNSGRVIDPCDQRKTEKIVVGRRHRRAQREMTLYSVRRFTTKACLEMWNECAENREGTIKCERRGGKENKVDLICLVDFSIFCLNKCIYS